MEKGILFIIILLNFSSCFTVKISNKEPDSIQIDYVDLYVTTPLNVDVSNFYTYFGKTVKTVIIKDKMTLKRYSEEMNKFVRVTEKVNVSPDVRLLATICIDNKKQIILMGTTLLNYKNENYITNDQIRAFWGELTGNKW